MFHLLTSESFRILLTTNMFYLILITKTFYLFLTTKTFYSLITTKTIYFSKTTAATYVRTHSQRSKQVSQPATRIAVGTQNTLSLSHSATQQPNAWGWGSCDQDLPLAGPEMLSHALAFSALLSWRHYRLMVHF